MSILDKLETTSLRHRRIGPDQYDQFAPHEPQVTLTYRPVDVSPNYNGYTYEEAYETKLVAKSLWYANGAQLAGRRQHAEKEMLHWLYEPVLNRLYGLRSAAMNRDYERVLLLCEDIEKEIFGD